MTLFPIRHASPVLFLTLLVPTQRGTFNGNTGGLCREGSHWVTALSRSCLQLCIPLPLCSPTGSPCCEGAVYPSCCCAREQQWLITLFASETASLQDLLPCMRPAAQARAASGRSRSAQGQWHSLDFSEAADTLAQPHLGIFLVISAKSVLESGQLLNTYCCIFCL